MEKKVVAIAVLFPFTQKNNAFPELWEDWHFHMTCQDCDPIKDLE